MPVSPEHFAAFVLASVILLVIPGPTIVMVITQALAHGRKVAFASVMGVGWETCWQHPCRSPAQALCWRRPPRCSKR
jgi:hypothetical protein